MSKKTDLLDQLPEQYKVLVDGLADRDRSILLKHLPNYNAYKDFANLVELGIDVAERRKEIDADPEQKAYGAQTTSTFSTILGVPESTIQHITKSVEVLGGDYLRELAAEASKKGLKLTYSHIRELNRLDSQDWVEDRQAIIHQILSGDIVTHRQVTTAVDALLGTVRKTSVKYVGGDEADEDKAFARADKKAAAGDALEDLATEKDIDKLCVKLSEAISQVDKKLDVIEPRITSWREEVSFETLESMCMDCLDAASTAASDLAVRVKDIALLLDDAMRTTVAAQAEI
jgi:hypothetical protein